jgi:hypothetical protein
MEPTDCALVLGNRQLPRVVTKQETPKSPKSVTQQDPAKNTRKTEGVSTMITFETFDPRQPCCPIWSRARRLTLYGKLFENGYDIYSAEGE